MKFTEAKAYYIKALRRDPDTPRPEARLVSFEEFHEWKAGMRAHDAARIELGLATPMEIQAENSAFPPRERFRNAKIIHYACYSGFQLLFFAVNFVIIIRIPCAG